MEKKRISTKTIVIIVISIVLLLALIGGGVYWYIFVLNADKNSPEEVLTQYVSYINEKDFESMYTLLSDSTKARVDKQTYLDRNSNIYNGIEATNVTISDLSYDKENKQLFYTMSMNTMAGNITFTNKATFDRQDDNKYYLNWYSQLIFPDLQSDYKVRVSTTQGKRGSILARDGTALAITGDDGTRQYPYGKATSHLLGYVRSISAEELEANAGKGYTESSIIGKTGLEKVYEDRLRPGTGCEIYITNSSGNKIETLAKTEATDGEDITTTIDIRLQDKIYKQLDGDNGLSVALNPKTGEVLALVSTPTYDSNDFIKGFSDEEWNKLNSDTNNPMLVRYQNTYVPGSSFKPITAAIGLTTGKMSADEDYGPSGLSWQNNSSWGNYRVTTLQTYSGPANLRNALIYSDNIYFAKSALKIGADTFAQQLLKIGFDTEMPFAINMDKSQFTENNTFASEVQLADTGYGQGKLLVNPLHVAAIYSAFVNEGNIVKPYIEYNENATAEYWIEGAFSKEAAETVRDDMIQTIENANGTGHEAKIEGVTLAGKTGTAEIKASQDDDSGTELGWFNAFRVSDNPNDQLLIVNMIEDVKDRGGSHYLLPKVKAMFE